MEEELWKTIEDYPNYEVSSFGNIKNKTTNKQLKLQKTYSGYLKISLVNINKKSFSCIVHRLVAKAFIPNPENKPTVNHIDKNRSNNSIYNLEWATMSEQIKHLLLNREKILKPINNKPIYKLDNITNNIIEEYKSISDAAIWIIDNNLTTITEKNRNNISIISSKICAVANNKRNNAYNFKWKYAETNTCIDNEIWKEIPFQIIEKYNYFVSNLGRFKNNKNEIKTNYIYNSGYKRISINRKMYLLHRLVLLTFLENPENKEFVNHKDGNKLNNLLENLEWATCLENNLHKINNGLSNSTKKIIQYDIDMNKLNEFKSIVECSMVLNISSSCISDNCRGKTKSTKCGYIFRYAE
jgi:hypothetical protein